MNDRENYLENELIQLSDKAKLLFAVLTCDHLYPNYVHFNNAAGWGNPRILRNAINSVFMYLIDDSLFDTIEIRTILEEVDGITPDTEDFTEVDASFALDACTAVLGTLQFIIEPKVEFVIQVASYATDTVDMFILDRDDFDSNDPKVEVKVREDPLMIREKDRQSDLIKKLSTMNLSKITDTLFTSLRADYTIINLY